MQAVFLEAGTVTVRQAPLPEPRAGEALLRLRVAGICNTDLELQRGYYGFQGIPGHEFVADVVDADDGSWVGKRVVGEINLACGRCAWCQRGMGRHCPARKVLGILGHPGAFAEYLTLPLTNLFEVPHGVPDDVAVFTEPLAAACAIPEQVPIASGVRAAVLGDGKLGLLCALVLALHGARVTLLGRHERKLALARTVGIVTRLAIEPCGETFPIVVEATGNPEGLATAIRLTEPRGKLVMKSTMASAVAVDMASLIVSEISLVGSRCGRFQDALPLLGSEALPLEAMIEAEYPLVAAPVAFAHAARKGTRKVLLRP